jgi:hypothetical protein
MTNSSSARIGIVTVTYNSSPFLGAFFQSLSEQTHEGWHLYAIDNASKDHTLETLSALADERVTVTPNSQNVGVAKGNNQGIEQALEDGCDWVLLLNNDTTFPPDLLSGLLGACGQRSWKAVVPKIHFDTPPGHLWYCGGSFKRARGYTGHHNHMGEKDRGQADRATTVDYSPTCCMLLSEEVFAAVGLMDETYFVYADDTDFCWRMKEAGISLGYWPASTLTHRVGGSTGGQESPFSAYYQIRNRMYFLRKFFGVVTESFFLPLFYVWYFFRFRFGHSKPQLWDAALRGLRDYRKLIPNTPALTPRGVDR